MHSALLLHYFLWGTMKQEGLSYIIFRQFLRYWFTMIKKQFYILPILSASLFALFVLISCGAERNFKRGEKHLALGEYFDAANEYKQAYQKTPSKDR